MKPNINSVEVHPQLRKKRTSSGWCPGWVLVHCGLQIDPPVCEETECHFIISLAVSVPSSVRSAQVVLDHANIALEMLGGFPLADAWREIISGTPFSQGVTLHKNFPWYPSTGYHGKKFLPGYSGF
jgi:hypothetical protein